MFTQIKMDLFCGRASKHDLRNRSLKTEGGGDT